MSVIETVKRVLRYSVKRIWRYSVKRVWGSSNQPKKESNFFEGWTLTNIMNKSKFGQFMDIITKILSPEEIKECKLPTVVVIGRESAGKSSLLENITKCDIFPRDQKTCTKCPVLVKLSKGSSKYSISYIDYETNKLHNQQINTRKEIYNIIFDCLKKIPIDKYSENVITIEITEPFLPEINFYDLPGIRAYPPELAKITTDITKKYLNDKNSIIICVESSTQTRLTASQSIALVSELKLTEKTILALTMIDKLDYDIIEDQLIKRITDSTDEFKDMKFLGCIGVINRNHKNEKSLYENEEHEKNWLKNIIFDNIPEYYKKHEKTINNNLGIKNLLDRIDNEYNNFIDKDWKPKTLKLFDSKINTLKIQYEDLGINPLNKNFNKENFNNIISNILFSIFNEQKYKYDEIPINTVKNDYKTINIILENLDDTIDNYLNIDNYDIINVFEKLYDELQIHDNIKYRLNRFKIIKSKLIKQLKDNFDDYAENNRENIIIYIRNEIYKVCVNNESEKNIHNILTKLINLLIFYPLLNNIAIIFNNDDYIESDEFLAKRKAVHTELLKTEESYKKIEKI